MQPETWRQYVPQGRACSCCAWQHAIYLGTITPENKQNQQWMDKGSEIKSIDKIFSTSHQPLCIVNVWKAITWGLAYPVMIDTVHHQIESEMYPLSNLTGTAFIINK